MTNTARQWILVASILGALAVIFGAFGAHAVPSYLENHGLDAGEIAQRLENFHTAARYHMFGALFLFCIGLATDHLPKRALTTAAWAMTAGVLVFCGAVYAVALVPVEMRGLFGRIAPVGGGLMIVAWIAAAVGAARKDK